MSYIRTPLVGQLVKGTIEKGYVFQTEDFKTKKVSIESFGHSKEALIEMLYRHWETEDKLFKDWLIRELAKELKVNIRKKPLTKSQQIDKTSELVTKISKEYKEPKPSNISFEEYFKNKYKRKNK